MTEATKPQPDPDPNMLGHCKPECGELQGQFSHQKPIDDINQLWDTGHRLADHRRHLYRGETNAAHRLHTTLDRQTQHPARGSCQPGPSARDIETLAFRSFQREAHHHLSPEELPQGDDPMEWLAVMRHYGAPTRLLDWSYSFWVSLFFAAAGARDQAASVWVVDDEWAQEVATDALRKKTNCALQMYEGDLHCRARGTFDHVYVQECGETPFVQKQNAWRRNARLVAQQGCFLCPGDVTQCFQSNLAAMRKHPATVGRSPVLRVDFSPKLIPDILDRLDSYGVNYATMYPDLEGIGKNLSLLPLVRRRHASELRFDGGIGDNPGRRRGEM
jgi:hypothetical protein